MMDYETAKAAEIGQALRGVGVNLLCRDVRAMAGFLQDVLGLDVHRLSPDYAIASHDGMILQLHSDTTYGAHPVLGLLGPACSRSA